MLEKLLKLTEWELGEEIKQPNLLRIYPITELRDRNGIAILWAPLQYLNRSAQLAIVGVTPGPTQAMLSYKAVRRTHASGEDSAASLIKAKTEASFRGKVMEANLKSLLEHSGVAERAGIQDIDNLWSLEADKVHFTSAIRYPTFFNGELFNNQINVLTHSELKRYVEIYLAEELSSLPTKSLIVALGSKGPEIVRRAATCAGIDHNRIIDLPHPSGSANGAVRSFLASERTKSSRPCRCMLCDRSRIPAGWDLSKWFPRPAQHTETVPEAAAGLCAVSGAKSKDLD